jgi:hypothetical protein
MAMHRKRIILLDVDISKDAAPDNKTTAKALRCFFSFFCDKSSDDTPDQHCEELPPYALMLTPLRLDDKRKDATYYFDQITRG